MAVRAEYTIQKPFNLNETREDFKSYISLSILHIYLYYHI